MKAFSGKAAVAVGLMTCAAAPLLAQGRDPELYDGGESDFGVQYVEEKGIYFGLGVGVAKSNQDVDEFNDAFLSRLDVDGFEVNGGSSELEDSDTAFALAAGYNFNENLGAEISYINFGTVEYRARAQVQIGPNTPIGASSTAEIETQGLALSGIGRLPVSDAFAVRTRLGVIFTKSDVDFSADLPSSTGSVRIPGSDSSNETNLFVSIGATYSFENRWTVSLDYEILKRTGDDDFLDDIGVVSLGLAFRL